MLTMLTGEAALDLAPYEESVDEPTLDLHLTKSDAIHEAHELMRVGENEAAGVWFLVAGSMR